MKDVAAQAGVALKTVSRVVNGEPGVGPGTLARVEQAIIELGYRRNESARQLRSGRAGTLAMVVRDIADPFFAAIGRAVEMTAHRDGQVVMIGSTHEDPKREREVALAFCARRPDALILAPIADSQDYLHPEVEAGLPVVAIDRPAHGILADTVLSDNVGGIRAAVAHLVSHGHRRIGYLGDDQMVYTARERVVAYRAALAEHGIAGDEALVRLAAPTPEGIAHSLGDLLGLGPVPGGLAGAGPVTALITANNRITAEVLRQLPNLPRRTALIGFDDLELADLLVPGLTVIAQDAEGIGRAAMELLDTRLTDPRLPAREVRIPTTLIIRGSAE
ncbi:LacI family DNA-binding transcriptional regulator [Longispora fulva]|uniref:LacI family DNA-binding transcriptional regulator n=1 Tax=Longispora fulva TaxID=619741 RepID=UPI0018CB831C|nr:LacI family DNA-binding transcriptional regulator [Longispora fulva]